MDYSKYISEFATAAQVVSDLNEKNRDVIADMLLDKPFDDSVQTFIDLLKISMRQDTPELVLQRRHKELTNFIKESKLYKSLLVERDELLEKVRFLESKVQTSEPLSNSSSSQTRTGTSMIFDEDYKESPISSKIETSIRPEVEEVLNSTPSNDERFKEDDKDIVLHTESKPESTVMKSISFDSEPVEEVRTITKKSNTKALEFKGFLDANPEAMTIQKAMNIVSAFSTKKHQLVVWQLHINGNLDESNIPKNLAKLNKNVYSEKFLKYRKEQFEFAMNTTKKLKELFNREGRAQELKGEYSLEDNIVGHITLALLLAHNEDKSAMRYTVNKIDTKATVLSKKLRKPKVYHSSGALGFLLRAIL